MTEVHALSATELLAEFRTRSLSPLEVIRALIERIERLGPEINAVGDTYFDEALAHAREAERRYGGDGTDARPLEGLPLAVKDELELAGKRTTFGSLLFEDVISESTDPVVERLVDAGAIVHARTLAPEFSVAFWTHSRLWGVTRNPWNREFDVGGSSGGSAASLAAGFTPLALGTDIGGSVRVPASCCGVVGYIGPRGRFPVAPPYNLDHWSNTGPMTRTVGDCALLADAMAGAHPVDHVSLPAPPALGVPSPDVAGLRIGVTFDFGDWPVASSVREAVADSVDALRAAGAIVEEIDLVVERELVRVASDAHHALIFGRDCAALISGREEQACAYTRWWVDSLASPPDPLVGLRAEAEIQRRVDDALSRCDALLGPAMCIPAFAAGVDHTVEPLVLDGVELDTFHDICPTEIFNVASSCPVLAVPAGRDPLGVPIGIQVVGRTYDDPTVFRIGAALEHARPWPRVAHLG